MPFPRQTDARNTGTLLRSCISVPAAKTARWPVHLGAQTSGLPIQKGAGSPDGHRSGRGRTQDGTPRAGDSAIGEQ